MTPVWSQDSKEALDILRSAYGSRIASSEELASHTATVMTFSDKERAVIQARLQALRAQPGDPPA
jgi:hypothetical protein